MPVVVILSASAMGGLGALAALALQADAALAAALWLGAGSLGTLPALRQGLRPGKGAQTP